MLAQASLMANKLSNVTKNMNLGNKGSFTKAFLDDMAQEETVSKKSLRLELARAKNKEEKSGQNMRKMKERIKIMLEKLREEESHFEAVEADRKRLEKLLEK